jgi:hypothetical protein
MPFHSVIDLHHLTRRTLEMCYAFLYTLEDLYQIWPCPTAPPSRQWQDLPRLLGVPLILGVHPQVLPFLEEHLALAPGTRPPWLCEVSDLPPIEGLAICCCPCDCHQPRAAVADEAAVSPRAGVWGAGFCACPCSKVSRAPWDGDRSL